MKSMSAWHSKLILTVIAFVAIACEGYSQGGVPVWKDPAWQESAWKARGCFDDQRGRWFRAAKFGAFIHFGPYSQLGGYYKQKGPYDPAEQIMGLGERHMVIPWQEYQAEVGGAFNPTNFNARQWVSLIKR